MKSNIFILAGLLVIISAISCTKDPDKPVVTPKTKTEILAYKPWMVQESYEMEANVVKKYERGQSGNTVNYDNDLLTFYKDNTGLWKDIYGGSYPIDWNFTNADQTKMRLTIHFSSTNMVPLDYNMVQISDSSFSITFTQTNKATGNTILASVRRVWKP